jgi:hypothetical protein
MILEDPDLLVAAARQEVLAWVQPRSPGWHASNAELAAAFVRLIAGKTDLELRTVRNPSACVYEARWYHGGRETAEFRKPFSAEAEPDARVLACAAMLALH